jgi:uncharacterized protein (DUF1697 family)
MHTFISLLRGINVSGQKRLLMPELKALYEALGFEQVITYLQSGNVIFDSSDADRLEISAKIEKGIQQTFGYQVPVFLRDRIDFQRIIHGNPFIHRQGLNLERLYVTFLSAPPAEKSITNLDLPAGVADEFISIGAEIYLHIPGGYGRTILSNNFFEKKLDRVATTRNWRTVNTLYDLPGTRDN